MAKGFQRGRIVSNETKKKISEAHHDDYNQPLKVRWLCFEHHRDLHNKIYENPELLGA